LTRLSDGLQNPDCRHKPSLVFYKAPMADIRAGV
jgi:hypothetical protein